MTRYGIKGINDRYLTENDIIPVKDGQKDQLFVKGIHFGIYDSKAEAIRAMNGKNDFRRRCLEREVA